MANTRILSLMFHRVNDESMDFRPEAFAQYLQYLTRHFPIVIPGEPLPDVPLAIMLTFDDAYADFYFDVFPLLKKHNIKALLAVPAKFIIERTTLSPAIRLSVPYAHDMHDPTLAEKVPFCTFEELREMQRSDHVVIASHGYAHANLEDKNTNVEQEIVSSKAILEQQLDTTIQHFVYPFGKMTPSVHHLVRQHYDFGIRIGSALNQGWDRKRHFIYRINADPLWTTQTPISKTLLSSLNRKYWINRIRLK